MHELVKQVSRLILTEPCLDGQDLPRSFDITEYEDEVEDALAALVDGFCDSGFPKLLGVCPKCLRQHLGMKPDAGAFLRLRNARHNALRRVWDMRYVNIADYCTAATGAGVSEKAPRKRAATR